MKFVALILYLRVHLSLAGLNPLRVKPWLLVLG